MRLEILEVLIVGAIFFVPWLYYGGFNYLRNQFKKWLQTIYK